MPESSNPWSSVDRRGFKWYKTLFYGLEEHPPECQDAGISTGNLINISGNDSGVNVNVLS